MENERIGLKSLTVIMERKKLPRREKVSLCIIQPIIRVKTFYWQSWSHRSLDSKRNDRIEQHVEAADNIDKKT